MSRPVYESCSYCHEIDFDNRFSDMCVKFAMATKINFNFDFSQRFPAKVRKDLTYCSNPLASGFLVQVPDNHGSFKFISVIKRPFHVTNSGNVVHEYRWIINPVQHVFVSPVSGLTKRGVLHKLRDEFESIAHEFARDVSVVDGRYIQYKCVIDNLPKGVKFYSNSCQLFDAEEKIYRVKIRISKDGLFTKKATCYLFSCYNFVSSMGEP